MYSSYFFYISQWNHKFIISLHLRKKTKYLKVGHYLEPSRCKTTSTVTFCLEIQASTSILFQSIREHNIPNTVDLQKKQNPNIQQYKIIRHVIFIWARSLAETQQSVCPMIFTLFHWIHFCKAEVVYYCRWSSKFCHNPCCCGLQYSVHLRLNRSSWM